MARAVFSKSVHAALGNHLAIEMRELFQKPNVLQQRRPARACAHDVLVVDDRRARVGGQLLLVAHVRLLPLRQS
jgi:hypothetical protein